MNFWMDEMSVKNFKCTLCGYLKDHHRNCQFAGHKKDNSKVVVREDRKKKHYQKLMNTTSKSGSQVWKEQNK